METTKEEGANLSDLFLVPEGSPLTTKSSLKLPVTRCRNWSLCSASSFPHTTRRRCWRGASTPYWRTQSPVNWRSSSSPMAAPIAPSEIARGYGAVGVIEVPEASKHAALNARRCRGNGISARVFWMRTSRLAPPPSAPWRPSWIAQARWLEHHGPTIDFDGCPAIVRLFLPRMVRATVVHGQSRLAPAIDVLYRRRPRARSVRFPQ